MSRAVVLAVGLLASLSARAAGTVTIALRPKTAVDGSRVVVADVAEVTGTPAELVARVRAVDLGPAPDPRFPRQVSREHVALRLRQERLDGHTIAWSGAAQTRVARQTNRVPGMALAQEAAAQVRKALPWPDEDLVVEVQRAPSDLLVVGSTHDLTYRVSLPPGRRVLGTVSARVAVSRGRRVLATAGVVLNVRVFQGMVVATRPIARGERLTKDNVRVQRVELTSATDRALTDLREALGREAKHDVRRFDFVTRRAVVAARVVQRGGIVTLVAVGPGLRISAKGAALQDGAVGQTIGVRNIDSKKTVYGRVVDGSTVQVTF